MDATGYWLTVGAVANVLHVSGDTVRRWADLGLLHAYRLPSGHRRFDRSAVQRFRDDLLKGKAELVR
jgi:excisionase family DNA binding protein